MDLEEELKIEYKRLLRHVNFLEKRYSAAVARDLAASLRNWVQLSGSIDELVADKVWDIKLTTSTTSKATKKIRAQSSSVSISLPGGVKSSNIQVAGAYFQAGKLSQEEVKRLYQDSISTKSTPKNVSFGSWLDATAYSVRDNGSNRDISRKIFIDRSANLLGGTHPISNFIESEHATWADPYVVDSLNTMVGVWPVPYATLMESAQELLRAFRPYLDS